jgi:hypothetical protein
MVFSSPATLSILLSKILNTVHRVATSAIFSERFNNVHAITLPNTLNNLVYANSLSVRCVLFSVRNSAVFRGIHIYPFHITFSLFGSFSGPF